MVQTCAQRRKQGPVGQSQYWLHCSAGLQAITRTQTHRVTKLFRCPPTPIPLVLYIFWQPTGIQPTPHGVFSPWCVFLDEGQLLDQGHCVWKSHAHYKTYPLGLNSIRLTLFRVWLYAPIGLNVLFTSTEGATSSSYDWGVRTPFTSTYCTQSPAITLQPSAFFTMSNCFQTFGASSSRL